MRRVINNLKKKILKNLHDEIEHRDKKKRIVELLIDIDEIICTKKFAIM